jgi:hypothetical protein
MGTYETSQSEYTSEYTKRRKMNIPSKKEQRKANIGGSIAATIAVIATILFATGPIASEENARRDARYPVTQATVTSVGPIEGSTRFNAYRSEDLTYRIFDGQTRNMYAAEMPWTDHVGSKENRIFAYKRVNGKEENNPRKGIDGGAVIVAVLGSLCAAAIFFALIYFLILVLCPITIPFIKKES